MMNDQSNKRKLEMPPSDVIKDKYSKSEVNTKLTREFFDVPCIELANKLLGKILVRCADNVILKGRIIETECYPGGDDKASHSYNGRRTPSNKPMYMPSGTSYVYMTYGMYYCFNISSVEPGGAVLIRALEPIEGLDYMNQQRTSKRKSKKPLDKDFKIQHLCNGPSKLCMAMSIDKSSCNMIDMPSSNNFWVESDCNLSSSEEIIMTTRIGIDSTGPEAVNKLLRFYIYNNACVSKRDKKRENDYNETLKINKDIN